MRPIPHRTEEGEEEDGVEAADPLSSEAALAGEEQWLDVQEF
jgi:hypothetical protein